MGDLVVPFSLSFARQTFRYIDNTGISRSEFGGVVQTTSRGGDKVAAAIDFSADGGGSTTGRSRRAQLQAFTMALRGKQNRAYLTDNSSPRNGAFGFSELYTNPIFASGTTGWSSAVGSLSAADGVLRATVTSITSGVDAYQQPSVTQYVPYVLRALHRADSANAAAIRSILDDGVGQLGSSFGAGYKLVSMVPKNTTLTAYATLLSAAPSPAAYQAGSFVDLLFASVSRCLLSDSPSNDLLQSDDITNGSWTKARATATANVHTDPLGGSTGDKLTEDNSPGTHVLFQSGTRATGAADLLAHGYFLRSAGTRNVELAVGNTASNYSSCVFTLSGAGSAGSVTNTGTATNGRAWIRSVGGGWYYCAIVSYNQSATTIFAQAAMHNGSTTIYTGDNTSALGVWRFGACRSSSPSRGIQSTTTAVASTSQSGSPGIYFKGGRTPAEGALANAVAQGDWIEVDGQLCQVTASCDVDSTGQGWIQVSPPPIRALADNTPIIIHNPVGRFVFAGDNAGYANDPGFMTSTSLEFEAAPL